MGLIYLAAYKGQGKLFNGYLRLVDECSHCHTELGRIRADDAGDAGFDLQAVSSDRVDALDKTVTKLLRDAGVTDEWKNHTDLEPFSAA